MRPILVTTVFTAALIASAHVAAQDSARPDPEGYSTYIDGSVSPALLSFSSIVPHVFQSFVSEANGWTPDDLATIRNYADRYAAFQAQNEQANALAFMDNCRAYSGIRFQGSALAQFLLHLAIQQANLEEFARTLYQGLAANLSTEGAKLLDLIVAERIAPYMQEIRFDFVQLAALPDEHSDRLRAHLSSLCDRSLAESAPLTSSSSSGDDFLSSSEQY